MKLRLTTQEFFLLFQKEWTLDQVEMTIKDTPDPIPDRVQYRFFGTSTYFHKNWECLIKFRGAVEVKDPIEATAVYALTQYEGLSEIFLMDGEKVEITLIDNVGDAEGIFDVAFSHHMKGNPTDQFIKALEKRKNLFLAEFR